MSAAPWNSTSLDAAIAYRRRGWRVIPIPARSKNPGRPGWPQERWEETDLPPLFAQGQNVGVLMGEPSGNLVDVDIDRREALQLAHRFLPPTDAVFGRESNPASHCLYVCKTETKKYALPAGWVGDGEKDTLVEIRATGAQTVFPGSVHPEGEPIVWKSQGEPAPVETATLVAAVQCLHAAAVVLLAIRHALRAVPPDCAYDTWIKIAMALHAWDRDVGLRVWDEWSSRGAKKYRGVAELETHWKSFREDGAIHLGTLFHIAEEAGWQRLPRLGLYYSGPGTGSAPETGAGPDDWDPIIPFDAAEYGPPLPLEVLPPALRDFVETTAESKQVPPEMPALLALGAVAAAAAKRFEVIVGVTHHEQLNIFGLAAMDSGERKSPTAAAAFAPLEAYQEQLTKAATPKILRAAEARQIEDARLVELRRKAAKEADPTERARLTDEAINLALSLTEVPTAPRLLCGDTTPEALAVLLATQGGRMLQYDTEGGAFFNVIGGMYTKLGVTSLDVHLKGYTGEAIRFDRTTRLPVSVLKPALSLMLTTQPDQLKRLQRLDELKGRGLLARFAYVLPHPMVGYRTFNDIPMNAAATAAYAAMLRRLLDVEALPDDEPRPLTVLDDSWAVWQDYSSRVESKLRVGGELYDVRDWCAKSSGLVARLAGILHLAAGGSTGPIQPATVAAAVVCVECLTLHMKAVFSLIGGAKDEMARRALDWIRRHRVQRFTIAQAFDCLRTGLGDGACRDDLQRPLNILESRHYIRRDTRPPVQSPRGGRPETASFLVNPATHEVMP